MPSGFSLLKIRRLIKDIADPGLRKMVFGEFYKRYPEQEATERKSEYHARYCAKRKKGGQP